MLSFDGRHSARSEPSVSASVGFDVWSETQTAEALVDGAEKALAIDKADRERPVPAATNVML